MKVNLTLKSHFTLKIGLYLYVRSNFKANFDFQCLISSRNELITTPLSTVVWVLENLMQSYIEAKESEVDFDISFYFETGLL